MNKHIIDVCIYGYTINITVNSPSSVNGGHVILIFMSITYMYTHVCTSMCACLRLHLKIHFQGYTTKSQIVYQTGIGNWLKLDVQSVLLLPLFETKQSTFVEIEVKMVENSEQSYFEHSYFLKWKHMVQPAKNNAFEIC